MLIYIAAVRIINNQTSSSFIFIHYILFLIGILEFITQTFHLFAIDCLRQFCANSAFVLRRKALS